MDAMGRVHHFPVSGMHCQGCAASVERLLLEVEGVAAARVSYGTGMAQLDLDGAPTQDSLAASLARGGYSLPEGALGTRRVSDDVAFREQEMCAPGQGVKISDVHRRTGGITRNSNHIVSKYGAGAWFAKVEGKEHHWVMTEAMREWADANLNPGSQPAAAPLGLPVMGLEEGAESAAMASGPAGTCWLDDLDLGPADFDWELDEDMMGDLTEGMSRL